MMDLQHIRCLQHKHVAFVLNYQALILFRIITQTNVDILFRQIIIAIVNIVRL